MGDTFDGDSGSHLAATTRIRNGCISSGNFSHF